MCCNGGFFTPLSCKVTLNRILQNKVSAREVWDYKIAYIESRYRISFPRSIKILKCNKTYIMLDFVMKTLESKVLIEERGNNIWYPSFVCPRLLAQKPHFSVHDMAITVCTMWIACSPLCCIVTNVRQCHFALKISKGTTKLTNHWFMQLCQNDV
jgi:hypothetical protein